jgi:hypothetical protein
MPCTSHSAPLRQKPQDRSDRVAVAEDAPEDWVRRWLMLAKRGRAQGTPGNAASQHSVHGRGGVGGAAAVAPDTAAQSTDTHVTIHLHGEGAPQPRRTIPHHHQRAAPYRILRASGTTGGGPIPGSRSPTASPGSGSAPAPQASRDRPRNTVSVVGPATGVAAVARGEDCMGAVPKRPEPPLCRPSRRWELRAARRSVMRDARPTTMRVTSHGVTISPSMRTRSRPTSRCSWPHDTLQQGRGGRTPQATGTSGAHS